MSGHNAALALPPGERCNVLRRRIAQKKRRHQMIWDDLAKLKQLPLAQLRAELRNDDAA